jgi:hypothetical protein
MPNALFLMSYLRLNLISIYNSLIYLNLARWVVWGGIDKYSFKKYTRCKSKRRSVDAECRGQQGETVVLFSCLRKLQHSGIYTGHVCFDIQNADVNGNQALCLFFLYITVKNISLFRLNPFFSLPPWYYSLILLLQILHFFSFSYPNVHI